jgi:serine/threonine protein kinase
MKRLIPAAFFLRFSASDQASRRTELAREVSEHPKSSSNAPIRLSVSIRPLPPALQFASLLSRSHSQTPTDDLQSCVCVSTRLSLAIDIWSAGIILLSILTRKFPIFNSNDDTEALMEISAIFGKAKMDKCAAVHSLSSLPSFLPIYFLSFPCTT